MKRETFAPPEYREGLEADAVCGQCGNVNPEGTLICKTCGNNLRDQRMLRMAADQMLDAEEKSDNRPTLLIGVASVLGILLVLWLGISATRIGGVLTTAEQNTDGVYVEPGLFFTGANAAVYDSMRSALNVRFPSQADAEEARMNVAPMESLASGNYVLYEQLGTNLRFVGAAAVRAEGASVHYCASLLDGIEIRGSVSLVDDVFLSQWNQAAAMYQDDYYALSGTAYTEADGTVTLTGESNHSSRSFSALAYRYSAF
jgi:hypothetical protein